MANSVADQSPAVAEMQEDWALARALLGGTRAMRKAGKRLLPKWPDEEESAYQFRLSVSVLFPAYKRTVETLTGKPFSKAITRHDDIPAEMAEWLDDVDLQGRNIDAFAADEMEAAMGYGLSGILVDHPDAKKAGVQANADGVTTQAAEKAAGLRPYFVHIKPWQILGWRAERIKGQWRLTQFRFMEQVEEPDGAFGTKCIDQVRVLEPGRWETHRKASNGEEWVLYDEGVTSLDFIPFVPVYGKRKGYMLGEPPLLEVAHLNVKHWQSQSDQDNLLHVARVPILAARQVGDAFKITAGAGVAVNLGDGPDADLKFVEHSGAAIGAGKASLDDLKEEMRQAGAELLVIKPGDITATEVQTENAVGMCALQRIVQGLEDALDTALSYMAAWKKLDKGGHVTIFNDFGAATLAEASAQLLLDANQAGKISDETFHSELQRRGILSSDVLWEDEKERLEAQGPALGMVQPGDPLTEPATAGA